MNEPRVVESVTNECQSLGRAHESSSARAEQLIACLEGEIAKRDVELERLRAKTRTTMGVGSGDGQLFIHGDYESVKAAQRIVIERDRLRAELSAAKETISRYETTAENCDLLRGELAAIKAQGVVMPERDAVIRKAVCMCNRIPGSTTWNAAEYAYDELAARLNTPPVQQVSVPDGWKLVPVNATEAILDVLYSNGMDESDSLLQDIWSAMLAAAPVSEAKAQGVVQWPDADEIMQMAFEEGQPADDASGYCFELEEFDLFIERLMSEVARLNAAPVQRVSVPDGRVKFSRFLTDAMTAAGLLRHGKTDKALASRISSASMEYMLAAPAAPAADAGLVEALEMIINPIEAMRRELQGGEQLNGMVAMQLASDPEYLRGVAKAALAAHRAAPAPGGE